MLQGLTLLRLVCIWRIKCSRYAKNVVDVFEFNSEEEQRHFNENNVFEWNVALYVPWCI